MPRCMLQTAVRVIWIDFHLKKIKSYKFDSEGSEVANTKSLWEKNVQIQHGTLKVIIPGLAMQ